MIKETTLKPSVAELEDMLKSYGHPEIRVPFHSLYYKNDPPWSADVRLIFTDYPEVMTSVEWRKHIIDRTDVLINELRKIGWIRHSALNISFDVSYSLSTCTLSNKLVTLGEEFMNQAVVTLNLLPVSGELIDG